MNPYPLLFSNVRPTHLRGADVFSFEWTLRTARLACDAEDWPTAIDRLVKLATFVRADAQASTATAGLALCACADGNLPGRVESALHLLPHDNAEALDLLKPVLQHLAEHQTLGARNVLLGLRRHLPEWPWAAAALALRLEAEGSWSAAYENWVAAESTLPEARLRAGVAAMHAGKITEARERLRGQILAPENFAWVTLAWTKSPGRFDRFRGYDALEDALAAERRAEPGQRPALDTLQTLCKAIVQHTRPTLDQSEFERLQDIVRLAFDASEDTAADLESELRARREAHEGLGPQAAQAWLTLQLVEHPVPDHPMAELIEKARSGQLQAHEVQQLLNQPRAAWPALWPLWLNLRAPAPDHDLVVFFETWSAAVERPGCGWLRVAEYLHAHNMPALATAALQTALDRGETTPRDLLERVCEHTTVFVAEHRSDAELHVWLKRIATL